MPRPDLFDLSGRVAAVIGGTGVLGGAICHGLADAGAAVAVLGRSAERGQSRLAALQAAGASGDRRCGRRTRSGCRPGRHRRGRGRPRAGRHPRERPGREQLDAVLRDRPRGVARAHRLEPDYGVRRLPGRSRARWSTVGRGGSIINISSASSGPPLTRVLTYWVAKAGLNNLTQYLAARARPAPHPRQRDRTGLLPRRAEPTAAVRGPPARDRGAHAGGPPRRAGRARRCGGLAGLGAGVGLRDRLDRARRRRLQRDDDLSPVVQPEQVDDVPTVGRIPDERHPLDVFRHDRLPRWALVRHRFDDRSIARRRRSRGGGVRAPCPGRSVRASASASRSAAAGSTGSPMSRAPPCRAVRARGAELFVVPAMGSHGGATAEGQLEVLASLGITEATIGCEIRSSMETVQPRRGRAASRCSSTGTPTTRPTRSSRSTG